MAKKTYKITRFDLGRNSKYDARDLKEGELAEAININVTNPGYIATAGNLRGYWNASDDNVQDHTVGTFNPGGGTGADDSNITSLVSFANDFKMAFALVVDLGTNAALYALGNNIFDNVTKASGTVVGSVTTGGSVGNDNWEGTIYLINVYNSGNASAFANNNQLKVASTDVATVNGNTAVIASTEAPFLGLSDANTLDIYDDGTQVWLQEVLTLNNGIAWNSESTAIGESGGSLHSAGVHSRYFYTDGALRMADANFANINNYPKWLGQIKRDYLQNILNDDGTAQTRDDFKINSWWSDTMAPCPPRDINPGSNEKALSVVDSYAATYPTNGEKVFLKFRESTTGLLSVTAINLTDAATGLMTATTTTNSLSPGDEIVIQGSSYGGTYIVESSTSTTFTFYGNSTAADAATEGAEKIQTPGIGDGTGWGVETGWDVNSTVSDKAYYNDVNNGAALTNTLVTSIAEDTTYHLTFTVDDPDGTDALDIAIFDDADGTEELVSKTTYVEGTHHIYFTAPSDSPTISFHAYITSDGTGTLDDISLKEATVTVRKYTDAINTDLKQKWIFGMSFLYDGIAEQESPITVGWKDGTTQMDLGVTSAHVVDFRSYINKPECFISFVYDGTDDQSKNWHPRKTGFKLYMKRVDSSSSGEWLFFAHVDLIRGEYHINAGDGVVKSLHEGEANADFEVNLTGEDSLVPFNSVPLESYYTETFGVPEHLTHFRASWKAQATVNRVNYIGNVFMDDEHFPDRLAKSPPLRYDIFPNDENYVVDVMPADGDEIVHLESFGDRLLVFKKYTLIILNTNGVAEIIESKHTGMGVKNTRHVCAIDNGIAWINDQGLMIYNGESIKNLIEDKWNTVDLWQIYDYGQLSYDAKSKHLIMQGSKSNVTNSVNYIYDFFTNSFYYAWQATVVATSSKNLFSNRVNIPHDNELVFAGQKNTENIFFYKYQSSSQDTDTSAASLSLGFAFKTKDIDFGEPGVKKKIYKVYVTYRCSDSSASHSNVIVAYNINGEKSGPIEDTVNGGIGNDADWKHFIAKSNCTNVAGASSTSTCILDNNKAEWTVAEMKPSSGEASKVNSFQLVVYNKTGQAVDSTFQINDITIVYKIKKKK